MTPGPTELLKVLEAIKTLREFVRKHANFAEGDELVEALDQFDTDIRGHFK